MPVIKSKKNDVSSEQRLEEIKRKIQDESYIDNAIEHIALVMTRQILEDRVSSSGVAEAIFL